MSGPAHHQNGNGAGVGIQLSPLSYHSTTALGTQVTLLASLYRDISNAAAPASASATDSTAFNLFKSSTLANLMARMEALRDLDQELITYDAQMADYQKKCNAALTTVANAGVSPPAAVGIGVAGAVLGGTLGFMAAKHFGKDAES